MILFRISIVALSLLLVAAGGCTSAQMYIDRAIDTGKEGYDSQAKIVLATVCSMSIGAALRNLSQSQLAAVISLCRPAAAQ